MKAITLCTINIAVQTAKNLSHSMDYPTAFSKGFQLDLLKKRMMRGEVVRFAYMKTNGQIRFAVGTLQSDAVKANVMGWGTPKRFFGQFAYLDMQSLSWKSFKENLFIGIVD